MKRDYLSSLSRAARWYLPPAEAAEVVEDYQDIVGRESRSEEELCRDVGTPRNAVKRLVRRRSYYRWLAVFAALAACMALPMVTPLWQELAFDIFQLFRFYWFWEIGGKVIPFRDVIFVAGMVLSLLWFRRNGGKDRTMPRGVLPLLILLLAGIALIWFVAWLLLGERWELMNFLFPTLSRVSAMRLTMGLDIFVMGLIGLFGLVQARLGDRRWIGVYVLALAGVILGLSVWAYITSMALPSAFEEAVRYICITFAGLVGTVVALC